MTDPILVMYEVFVTYVSVHTSSVFSTKLNIVFAPISTTAA